MRKSFELQMAFKVTPTEEDNFMSDYQNNHNPLALYQPMETDAG